MKAHNLGYPRIGNRRELKKACEQYWSGQSTQLELLLTTKRIRAFNWTLQKNIGLDLIPSNDFSLYDHVLDTSMMVGAIPERYHDMLLNPQFSDIDLYFAMARGYQGADIDTPAMEMTKWFDTNYHYIVPEFRKNQSFKLLSYKVIQDFLEARELGIATKPVILGPVSYLLLGKEKEKGFHRISLLENILPVYLEVLKKLDDYQAEWVQLDEPFLTLDIDNSIKEAYLLAYNVIRKAFPKLKILVATYFEALENNISTALSLPVCALHLDLVRAPQQLDAILPELPPKMSLSLGVVDGRNIWKNDFTQSLQYIHQAMDKTGPERILIAPSCSLLHVPCDLELEKDEQALPPTLKHWMAFAKQKVEEVVTLKALSLQPQHSGLKKMLEDNQQAHAGRQRSSLIHKQHVQQRIAQLNEENPQRTHAYAVRKTIQQKQLQLPLFPTTTIGSFPQTNELRQWRAQFKKGLLAAVQYEQLIKAAIKKAIHWQESLGIDVLVHGEFERNDMVEYFGEQLEGFAFTQNGWVQSYGSRCVKPPIIFGDVERKAPMTVHYTQYAQSLTRKWVKGMLTGPVTMLQWSFVRNDQPRSVTCRQIACAIQDEVKDLEKAGIRIIQIDEPAIREGLPLRKEKWAGYLQWAVAAFRLSHAGVKDETQIHTHMCYSEFNDIIDSITAMDADVITIETSRSQMELLEAFAAFKYPNDIGPGVYDIHSPRIPHKEEIISLLQKALKVIPARQLWVNPDCGLKTRAWQETEAALKAMVEAAGTLREQVPA